MDNKTKILAGILLAGLLLFAFGSKSAAAAPGAPPSKTKLPSGSNGGQLTGQIAGQVANTALDILKKLFGTGSGNGTKAGGAAGGGSTGSGTAGSAKGGTGQGGAQTRPDDNTLQSAGYSRDSNGVIYDQNGSKVGQTDANDNWVFNDGSVFYADGTVWDQKTGYFTDSTGCVYLDNGTIIGQVDADGNIESVDNAIFDGAGTYLGSDNGDGSYTAPNDDIINSTTGVVEGYDNGDGTWLGTDGIVYLDDNTPVGTWDTNSDGSTWTDTSTGQDITSGDY